MATTPGCMPRWRSGPSLGDWGHHAPETEEEYVEYYQDRITHSQSRQLLPLMEDLADWLNKTLGLEHLTSSNLLDMLDNGVVLCHLARVIQERALEAVHSGLASGTPPVIKGRCFENAARRSFFSRDNMDKFIQFCRQLGVHQNLLFESDDLVLQNNPRSVVLCLMEVARIASRFNMEPPGLVALEKEIAEEESHDSGISHGSIISWQFQPTPTPKVIRHSSSASALSGWNKTIVDRRSLILEGEADQLRRVVSEKVQSAPGGGASDGVPSDTTEDDWSRGSGEDPDLEIEHNTTPVKQNISDLDRKVQHVTRVAQKHCHCSDGKCEKLKVKKVGEGKYNIAGRNVFVRLLKGRHMMVRVGGGWDTLEHFLQRHDPCQRGKSIHIVKKKNSLKRQRSVKRI
ncbi:growth arrest-specific protein 2-like isoform X2 [Macrosteles quadrilineatus]|uniref:growth arrest-specific protein 2-like isoform X2 n=1 Tax=Macrosteles quadrilineatus TaxID=74068 RepID=UPI0023E1B92C|nr:growth arrest-specific protein 2-like isoform X2 [Macrosteles quadrilineatus]